MKPWLTLCQELAQRESIEPQWIDCLQGFSRTQSAEPLQATSFSSLESKLGKILSGLPEQLEEKLSDEVDAPQAALFVRRLRTVLSLLDQLSRTDPVARLLRTGLLCRLVEILEGVAGLPRALRVRAAVDYFYSQAALLHHRTHIPPSHIRPWNLGMKGVTWTRVQDRIQYARLDAHTPLGPQRIHVLRAPARTLRMDTADRRTQVEQGLSLSDESRERKALVATSGGFFLYSEPDIEAPSHRGDPVGLLLNNTEVQSPPIFNRSALAWTASGDFQIAQQGLEGCRFMVRGQPSSILTANSSELMNHGVVAYSRVWGPVAPPGRQCSVVGDRICRVSDHTALPIPLNGYVLHFPDSSLPLPPEGGHLRLWLPEWKQDWISAMAGGPLLVEKGQPVLNLHAEDFKSTAPPRTFSGDETGDQNLLPRMAAGLDPRGNLYLVAVDGRDFHQALGLTLTALSEWMIGLGCTQAMNLDGGSSKRMVVAGEVMDCASTEVQDGSEENHQRPVRSALFFSRA